MVVWAGVEGAEWIIYEYSCSLPCSTKQKMAPRRETPPIQKWREERKGGNGGTAKNRGSQGRVMEDYGNWRQTERVVGGPGWVAGIHTMIPPHPPAASAA